MKLVAPLTAEQAEWFGAAVRTPERVNPCVRVHGLGPAGETCKACSHLLRIAKGKVYLKCDLRRISNGAATDHKAGWPACAKFEWRAEPC